MKKLNIKFVLFLLVPFSVCCLIWFDMMKSTRASDVKLGVDEQIQALLQTAHAYLRQGVQHQYDSYRKNLYSTPEDATSQHYTYTVCSGFTFQVYYQTFGIKIPDTTEELLDYAESNKNVSDTVLLFYGTSDEIYSSDVLGTSDVSNYAELEDRLVDILLPGDVVVVTGHAMMVDSVDVENRKITLIESGGGTRYDFVNHVDRFDEAGTIQYVDFSRRFKIYYNYLKNNKDLIERFAVIRFITDGEKYINTKNEIDTYSVTESALSRLNYPEIDIEKIVEISEKDNVVSSNVMIDLGEIITYNLTITNGSEQDYTEFDVVENIDSKVIVTDYGNGKLNDGQISWVISSLNAGESITLSYSVLVPIDTSLLGQNIVSTGRVDNISTSKIETLIGNKLNLDEKRKIYDVYNELKDNDQVEREFINQIYVDAFDLDIGITGVKNFELIGYDSNVSSGGGDILSVKTTKFINDYIKKYVYNNYYGLRIGEKNISNDNVVRAILQWNIYSDYENNDRARTIVKDVLNDGDIILVYNGENNPEDENLVDKSYIYLDNKLIRKISSTEFEDISGDDLIVFLRNLVGENYLILRPSIAMLDEVTYSDDFVIDEKNMYIKYLSTGVNVEDLSNKLTIFFGNSLNYDIYDLNNNKKNNEDVVFSGDKVVIHDNDKELEYYVSVTGDSNGDGIVDLIDLVQMRKHIVGWIDLNTDSVYEKTGVYYYSLDFNKDDIIDLVDLIRMRKKIVDFNN